MSDRVDIISGLVSFWTGPGGCLQVKNGEVVYDQKGDFNRARLYRNAGVGKFRVLRRGLPEWGGVKAFDWQDANYWTLLREHLATLHNPYQGTNPSPGAEIIFEPFDGSSETWMYADYAKARLLLKAVFANLGDLPYVKIGVGNELNQPEAAAFVRDVVYPEFKLAGKKPYSYGAYFATGTEGPIMSEQVAAALAAWDMATALGIYRQVHSVLGVNVGLTEAVRRWMTEVKTICIMFSNDGCVVGDSTCDFRNIAGWWGDVQRGPSVEQTKAMMKYVLDRLPVGGTGKYGFEHLALWGTPDACTVQTFVAMSQMYQQKFGVWPESYGRFTKDWVGDDPVPPPPPPAKQYTLSIKLGEGTGGMPARTAKYNKGKVVAYSYAAKTNYGLLKVKLDKVATKARGSIKMNQNHLLTTSATPKITKG